MMKEKVEQKRFMKALWQNFSAKNPVVAQFLVFFLLSNGVTVLQLLVMPLLKNAFELTSLVDVNFQIGQIGKNFDGSSYYIFNYASGSLADGGGGGLAYFLAVEIALGLAQILNFFAQRNITFKSNSNIWKAAFWYVVAYIIISISAAALQGLYKAPIYNLFMKTMSLGELGETIADLITMFINCTISFWVFFPIFKIIFKQEENK